MENSNTTTNELLPVEVKELAVKVSSKKQEEVQKILNEVFNGLADWERQIESIEVKDINDTMGMDLADTARKNVKKARIAAEKIFDAKREEVQNEMIDFKTEDSLWLKAKQITQIKMKAIEEKADWKASFRERYEAEQKALKIEMRIAKVAQYSTMVQVMHQSEYEHLSDEGFDVLIAGLEKTHNDKIEAERKAAEERAAKAKAEAEERERIEAENKRLAAEKAEIEAKAKAEKEEADKKLAEEKAAAALKAKEKEELIAKRNAELRPYIVLIRDYNGLLNAEQDVYEQEIADIKRGERERIEFEQRQAKKKFEESESRGVLAKKFLLESGYAEVNGGVSHTEYNHFIGTNNFDLMDSDEELEGFKKRISNQIESSKSAKMLAAAEKELAERKAADAKAQKEAEAKAKAEEEERIKAAKAPVKERLTQWIELCNMRAPGGAENEPVVAEILSKFNDFKKWSKTQIEKM